MINESSAAAFPREVPDYHTRRAAHLRALAANVTTASIKGRLLNEAEEHEQLAVAEIAPADHRIEGH